MIIDLLIIFLTTICFIYLFVSYIKMSNNIDYYKKENSFLKRNIDECYKYIDFLEKEKKEGHYD